MTAILAGIIIAKRAEVAAAVRRIMAPPQPEAVLPPNRLTAPMITWTGSSLVSIPGSRALAIWSMQTVLRYAPPVWVFARWRRGAHAEHARREAVRAKERSTSTGVGGRAAALH